MTRTEFAGEHSKDLMLDCKIIIEEENRSVVKRIIKRKDWIILSKWPFMFDLMKRLGEEL